MCDRSCEVTPRRLDPRQRVQGLGHLGRLAGKTREIDGLLEQRVRRQPLPGPPMAMTEQAQHAGQPCQIACAAHRVDRSKHRWLVEVADLTHEHWRVDDPQEQLRMLVEQPVFVGGAQCFVQRSAATV